MDTERTTAARQTKETFEKMGSATSDAAEIIKTGYSSSLKAVQDYNNKFMEFAHANTNATFDFAQKLYGVKSPAEFVELSTEHARAQTEALTEQLNSLRHLLRRLRSRPRNR